MADEAGDKMAGEEVGEVAGRDGESSWSTTLTGGRPAYTRRLVFKSQAKHEKKDVKLTNQ